MSAIFPDGWDTDLPASILSRHPELGEIAAALRQHRQRQPITVRCRACGGLLSATSIPEIGSLSVRCQPVCTAYRSRSAPDP